MEALSTSKEYKVFFCPEVSVASSFQNGPTFGEIEVVGCSYMEESGPIFTNVLKDMEVTSTVLKKISKGRALFVRGATGGDGKLDISKASDFIYANAKYDLGQRRSAETKRNAARSVLVFHITSDGVANTDSVDEISDVIFGTNGDQTNLGSQFAACSYNQVTIEAATGAGIVNGVVEVTVNPEDTEFDAISNAAKKAAYSAGISIGAYDHLMFALPRSATYGGIPLGNGYTYWAGLAQLQGVDSWYCNTMIVSKVVMFHEFGHNLGFQHSGEEQTYDDHTCIMGNNIGANGQACFNGAKMSESGWYSDREVIFDPQSGTSTSFKLINTNDYGDSTSDHAMPLQIVYGDTNGNLFAYYNKLEGMTLNSNEYRGEVVIDQRNLGTEYLGFAESLLLYHISEGSSQTISNFNGNDDLTISFESIGTDGTVDYALVNVQLGDVQPVSPPTTAPVSPPTTAPVTPPTTAPVSPPTTAPVFFSPPTTAPVTPPTTAPVSPPTTAPVFFSPPTAAPISPPTAAPVQTGTTNTLTTVIGGGSKVIGFMFSLQALGPISILNFKITAEENNQKIKYKIYKVDGSTLPPVAGWGSAFHKKFRKGKGQTKTVSLKDFVCPINMNEGDYKSFYILAKKQQMYSTKVIIKPSIPYTSDTYLKFMEQKAETTTSEYDEKYVWNGIITYLNSNTNTC